MFSYGTPSTGDVRPILLGLPKPYVHQISLVPRLFTCAYCVLYKLGLMIGICESVLGSIIESEIA